MYVIECVDSEIHIRLQAHANGGLVWFLFKRFESSIPIDARYQEMLSLQNRDKQSMEEFQGKEVMQSMRTEATSRRMPRVSEKGSMPQSILPKMDGLC